jgi:methionine-gamma-lyase
MNNSTGYQSMSSLAIHAAQSKSWEHAHLTPIFATSTFTFDNAEQGMKRFSGLEPGYIYSRFGNPTCSTAEIVVAALETYNITSSTGEPMKARALLHASGQAAMATMFLSCLFSGDAVLSNYSLYGGTFEFLQDFLPPLGISSVFCDMSDLNVVEETIKKTPALKMIHLETPSNPTMQCLDLEAICKMAKHYNLLVTVDNTFATPYLQQPFKYGADFIFHSTTKFLNGHGTSIGGVLIGKDIDFMETRVARTCKLLGSISNPFDAFLLIQGIKTLELRMDKHCDNAIRVAEFLSAHNAVSKVHYNGLPSHPDFRLTYKQMRKPGAVLSFELKGGLQAGKHFIDKLKMCVRAVSLGTIDTLISHPASMSHSGMEKEARERSGITDGLIRMSVGLEDINDILNDFNQALMPDR